MPRATRTTSCGCCSPPRTRPSRSSTLSWGGRCRGGSTCSAAIRPPPPPPRAGRGGCDLAIVNGYTRPDYLLATVLARRAGIATALRLDSVRWPDEAAARRPPRPRWSSRLLFAWILPRLYDLFLGVGSLSLDHLAACGVAAERRGLFPYAVDVEHFRAASRVTAEERAAARARLGGGPAPPPGPPR